METGIGCLYCIARELCDMDVKVGDPLCKGFHKTLEAVKTSHNSASAPCEQCEHFTGDFNNGVCGACRWSQPDKFTQRT